MKVFLINGRERHQCRVPHEGCDYVVVETTRCACGSDPFKVRGRSQRIADDDQAYEAQAVCAYCGSVVGTLRAETSTLFGLREDNAVLNGRARVYG